MLFNKKDYSVLFNQCEITVYVTVHDNLIRVRMNDRLPRIVVAYRGEPIQHLYGFDYSPCGLLDILYGAYKEMFYHHFSRKEGWKGKALERALSLAIISIDGSNAWQQCLKTNWATRYTSIDVGPFNRLNAPDPLFTLASGCTRLIGDTPVNGGQGDSMLVVEVTLSTDHTWTRRGSSKSKYPTKKLTLSGYGRFGDPIPTYKDVVDVNEELVAAFLAANRNGMMPTHQLGPFQK